MSRNLNNMKELDPVFVQEIDNMESITSHKHLKHINTSALRFGAEAQSQM